MLAMVAKVTMLELAKVLVLVPYLSVSGGTSFSGFPGLLPWARLYCCTTGFKLMLQLAHCSPPVWCWASWGRPPGTPGPPPPRTSASSQG